MTSFLKRPYTGGGEDGPKTYGELTSAYCLTVDPDGSVNDDYMRAAGQTGIPCSFIVGKSGLVEWIGHPMSMDKPLSDVVNDTWDRDAFTTAFRDRQAAKLLSRNFTGQLRAGDFDKAAATLSECAEKLPAMSINNLTWNVYEYSNRKEIPDSLLDAAVVATEKAIESVPDDAAILDTLAHLVHKQGDLDRAIQLQTKAVENAKGRIADQLADFLEELKSEQATITNESL